MPTCNWLDLQTLGSQPIMPKNLPNHWCYVFIASSMDLLPNPTGYYFSRFQGFVCKDNLPQLPPQWSSYILLITLCILLITHCHSDGHVFIWEECPVSVQPFVHPSFWATFTSGLMCLCVSERDLSAHLKCLLFVVCHGHFFNLDSSIRISFGSANVICDF